LALAVFYICGNTRFNPPALTQNLGGEDVVLGSCVESVHARRAPGIHEDLQFNQVITCWHGVRLGFKPQAESSSRLKAD
jgi:hypothetical protein